MAKHYTMAEMARKALIAMGVDVSSRDIREWVTRNHPGWQINKDKFKQAIYFQRRSMKDKFPDLPGFHMKQSSSPDPTCDDLLKAKCLADRYGGIDPLLKQVQAVSKIGAAVGGVERLQRCLETLQRLMTPPAPPADPSADTNAAADAQEEEGA